MRTYLLEPLYRNWAIKLRSQYNKHYRDIHHLDTHTIDTALNATKDILEKLESINITAFVEKRSHKNFYDRSVLKYCQAQGPDRGSKPRQLTALLSSSPDCKLSFHC